MIGQLENHTKNLSIHPKLKKLEEILRAHFEQCEREDNGKTNTKAIVFVSRREVVAQIVEHLKSVDGVTIRPVGFFGQATDGSGAKGFKRKRMKRKKERTRNY